MTEPMEVTKEWAAINGWDDDENWEEVPSPVPAGTRLGVSVTVRLAPADADHLYHLAKRWGCSYSQAVRRALELADTPVMAVAPSADRNFSNAQSFTGHVIPFRLSLKKNVPIGFDPDDYPLF